jgi:hypothetical protein
VVWGYGVDCRLLSPEQPIIAVEILLPKFVVSLRFIQLRTAAGEVQENKDREIRAGE